MGLSIDLHKIPDLDTNFKYNPVFSNGIFVMTGKYSRAERSRMHHVISDIVDKDADNDEEEIQMEGLPELPTDMNILAGFVQKIDVVGEKRLE